MRIALFGIIQRTIQPVRILPRRPVARTFKFSGTGRFAIPTEGSISPCSCAVYSRQELRLGDRLGGFVSGLPAPKLFASSQRSVSISGEIASHPTRGLP